MREGFGGVNGEHALATAVARLCIDASPSLGRCRKETPERLFGASVDRDCGPATSFAPCRASGQPAAVLTCSSPICSRQISRTLRHLRASRHSCRFVEPGTLHPVLDLSQEPKGDPLDGVHGPGGERDSLGPSLALALRAASTCKSAFLPICRTRGSHPVLIAPSETRKAPFGAILDSGGERGIARPVHGPRPSLCSGPACGCPDLLQANQSNPEASPCYPRLEQT
jgi:hypothetical protein